MNTKGSRILHIAPIHCLTYRHVAETSLTPGDGIAFSGGEIQFRGPLALPLAQAAEVRIEAVKGISPPLTAYIEVTRCDRTGGGGYHIAGVIKGIRTE